MRLVLNLMLTLIIAIVGGLGSAYFFIDKGEPFGALRSGIWAAWPHAGDVDADPYSQAIHARAGILPMGRDEGISFTTSTDNSEELLAGNCIYTMRGRIPQARLWTLTLVNKSGEIVTNPANRFGLNSRTLTRNEDGTFSLIIAQLAQPGNWLPIGSDNRFTLVLRLYDAQIAKGTDFATITLPTVQRKNCQ